MGTPQIIYNDAPAPIDRHKAVALLAYLTITGSAQHRDKLADLFWPELDQSRGRTALRRTLFSLTSALPSAGWVIHRDHIAFNFTDSNVADTKRTKSVSPLDIWLDVQQFREMLADCPLPNAGDLGSCDRSCLERLSRAVALYQGDFMEGFTLKDCPEFDHWQINQSEALRRDLASALERLAHCHALREEYETAIRYCRRWALLDLLDEQSHARLMQLYLSAGQRNAALREYEAYSRTLQSELSVSPQPAMTELYESIKNSQGAVFDPKLVAFDVRTPRQKDRSLLPEELPGATRDGIYPGKSAAKAHPESLRLRARSTLTVGREQELAQAGALWQQVLEGSAALLLVSGEPGIGKSHFARIFIEGVGSDKIIILKGECYSDGGMPYASIAQVVYESFRQLGMELAASLVLPSALADLVKIAPSLEHSFPQIHPNQRLDPQSEQQRIYDSFVSFCEAISRVQQAPLLLVLEDMHWSDIDSIHLVRYLVHRSQRARLRIMVLMTYRDTEINSDTSALLQEITTESSKKHGVEHIHLRRMGRQHTRELLAHLLSGPEEIDEALVDAVQIETEGNPFFIEEVCWSLLEERHSFEHGMIRMPATISEVILTRIRRLPTTCQKILWQAAFLGRKFSMDMLRGLTNLNEKKLIAALEDAKKAQILLEEEMPGDIKLTFAHSLIPFAMRESASSLRRRHEHQRVAAFLERYAPNDLSGLAFHYAACGNPLKAITYAQQAARQAMEVFAFEIALQQIRSVTNLLDLDEILHQNALRLSILEDLGDIYRAMGKVKDTVTVYQQTLMVWHGSIDKDRWTAVRLNRKLSETALNINQFAEFQRLAPVVHACLEEGLLLVKKQPANPETVRLLVTRARFSWYMRSHVNWEEAEKYARQAVVMAQKLTSPVLLSTALDALATVYGLKGLYRERVDVCRRRLELSYEPDFNDLKERTNILLQIGMALYDVGEYHSALGYLVEAENLGYQIRDIPKQADALVRQGQCWYRLDRWDELLAIESKIKVLEDHFTFRRMGVLTCFYFALQASTLYLRGERILASQLKDKAREIMLTIGGPEQMWVRNQHF